MANLIQQIEQGRITRQLPDFKDGDFSRATVEELWQAGEADVQRIRANGPGVITTEVGEKMRIHDLSD